MFFVLAIVTPLEFRLSSHANRLIAPAGMESRDNGAAGAGAMPRALWPVVTDALHLHAAPRPATRSCELSRFSLVPIAINRLIADPALPIKKFRRL
jgi:hypothetical protein